MNDHPALETERLVLKPLAPAHAAALHKVYADPHAMRFWSTPPHRAIEETAALVNLLMAGPGRSWAIHRRDGGTAIGNVYYLGNSGPPGMGYILHPSHWGQGLMSEAVRGALAFGYDRMGLDRVELWIDSRNLASQRVAERTGFKRRAAFRQKYAHQADSHEKLVYGMHSEEWRTAPGTPREQPVEAYSLHPILAVADVRRTAEYYRDRLGFEIDFLFGQPPRYASVSLREWTATGACIHLSHADAPPAADAISLYVNVGPDIDRLCARYKAKGVAIAAEPASMPWGQREFAVKDCNGYTLRFGTPA